MVKKTGSFLAMDRRGRVHTINIFSHLDPDQMGADPREMVENYRELRTETGLHVNRLEPGKYVVAETGLLLLSESSEAF